MELTTLVGRLLCVVYLSIGVGALVNKNYYAAIVKDFFKNKGLVMSTGFMTFILSFLLVSYHNIWEGWAALITLFGWLGLIKGISFLAFPEQMEDFSKGIFASVGFSRSIAGVAVVLGLVCGWVWFL